MQHLVFIGTPSVENCKSFICVDAVSGVCHHFERTSQAALSRLETGIGGNIHAVFVITDYLNNNGYEGHMLFRKVFDITLITHNIDGIKDKKQLANAIEALKEQTNVNFETLLLRI